MVSLIVSALLLAAPGPALAASQLGPQPEPPDKPAVTLVKGTKCVKLAPGQLRFILPTGAMLELSGCRRDQKKQLVADKGHFMPAPGTLGWSASGARVASGPKPAGEPSAEDVVKIDDDVMWLPAVVSFKGKAVADTPGTLPSVTLVKGTTCARLGPGHVRLTLPGGAVLELSGCRRDQKRQLIADSGHYVPAPGKPGWTAQSAKITGGAKPPGVASLHDYVKIDDDVTWLPAIVSFVGIVDPDPPPQP